MWAQRQSAIARRHEVRSRRCSAAGAANPTEGSISNTLHIVTVSIPRCERGGAGATPAVGIISSSCARQRAEPAVCKTALPSASLGRTSTFHRIRESQRTHLVWDQEVPGAAPGYPTISLVCSSVVEHQAHNLKRAGSNPAGPTISKSVEQSAKSRESKPSSKHAMNSSLYALSPSLM